MFKVINALKIQIRSKTYRRSLTKLQQKYEIEKKFRKATGLPPLVASGSGTTMGTMGTTMGAMGGAMGSTMGTTMGTTANTTGTTTGTMTNKVKLESRLFRVENGMKIYKPVTPGLRNKRHPTRFHLWKGPAIKRLSIGKRSTGGRNCHGRITTRHRGGGHKKRIRLVDFYRATPGEYQVLRMEYDPNRSGELLLIRSMSTNELSYIIRPLGVEVGAKIYSFPRGVGPDCDLPKTTLVKPGNCLPLKEISVGSFVHCVGLTPSGPGILCRSAGTSALVMSRPSPSGFVQLRLSSKEVRMVHASAIATLGIVANDSHKLRNWGKAGARRLKGWRPSVRGIAMNPVDHPHGGGRKSKGGKAARSPWGWLTKGPKTVKRKRWFIVTPRWKATKK